MKRLVFFIFLLIVSCFFIFSNLSNNKARVALEINRFEHELFSVNKHNIAAKTDKWQEIFGSFNEVFSTQIMRLPYQDTLLYYNELLAFTQNQDMREAYDSISFLFSDFSDVHMELELAFGRISNVFPSYPIPKITTFFGGFNFGVITYDHNIGIGLENFLGQNSKFYKYLGDPKYLRFQKQKKFICPNVIEVWFDEYFYKYLGGRDFLSQMIYKGKMMYFLDNMLPELPIEDKFRFTKRHMAWVQENEFNIWEYLINEDLLFSSKESEFRSFIHHAPFVKGMPNESPGRLAYFIGFKIVSSYMKNNQVDIEELLSLMDSKDFLRLSKYKPTK